MKCKDARNTLVDERPCQKVFYLPLEQLEQYLLGVFYANDFNQRMGRVI